MSSQLVSSLYALIDILSESSPKLGLLLTGESNTKSLRKPFESVSLSTTVAAGIKYRIQRTPRVPSGGLCDDEHDVAQLE
jgi:hypothetical protein